MLSNYLIYLYTLPKVEQLKQVLILIIFFFIAFISCSLIDFFKSKFWDKHKE